MGPEVEWFGVSGNHYVGANNVRLIETQIWYLLAISVGGGFSKGKVASTSTSVRENAAFPSLTLITDNSFLPYVCGAFRAAAPGLNLRVN